MPLVRGYRNAPISPFFAPSGSGSISRLVLTIRSLLFSAEWLFYQKQRFFFPFFFSSTSVWEGLSLDAPLSSLLYLSLFVSLFFPPSVLPWGDLRWNLPVEMTHVITTLERATIPSTCTEARMSMSCLLTTIHIEASDAWSEMLD